MLKFSGGFYQEKLYWLVECHADNDRLFDSNWTSLDLGYKNHYHRFLPGIERKDRRRWRSLRCGISSENSAVILMHKNYRSVPVQKPGLRWGDGAKRYKPDVVFSKGGLCSPCPYVGRRLQGARYWSSLGISGGARTGEQNLSIRHQINCHLRYEISAWTGHACTSSPSTGLSAATASSFYPNFSLDLGWVLSVCGKPGSITVLVLKITSCDFQILPLERQSGSRVGTTPWRYDCYEHLGLCRLPCLRAGWLSMLAVGFRRPISWFHALAGGNRFWIFRSFTANKGQQKCWRKWSCQFPLRAILAPGQGVLPWFQMSISAGIKAGQQCGRKACNRWLSYWLKIIETTYLDALCKFRPSRQQYWMWIKPLIAILWYSGRCFIGWLLMVSTMTSLDWFCQFSRARS